MEASQIKKEKEMSGNNIKNSNWKRGKHKNSSSIIVIDFDRY